MEPSAATRVFQRRGHEWLVECMLGYLDWRSILRAGMACTNLNDIVTGSSHLQLRLRAAFYGFPSSYADFDHPLYDPFPSTSERMERLLEVQNNWANLKPKQIHVFRYKTSSTHYRVTCGLIIAPKASHSWGGTGPTSSWNSWWIWDAYNLRDTPYSADTYNLRNANPTSPQPIAVAMVDDFEAMDASREDNLVVVSHTKLVNDDFHVTLSFFLLEPPPEWDPLRLLDPNDPMGAHYRAVPHPDAATITFSERSRDPGSNKPKRMVCSVKLGPHGALMTTMNRHNSTRLWNWRTRKQKLCYHPQNQFIFNRDTLVIGYGHLLCAVHDKPKTDESDRHPRQNLALALLRKRSATSKKTEEQPWSEWIRFTRGTVWSRFWLPHLYAASSPELATDRDGRLLVMTTGVKTRFSAKNNPRSVTTVVPLRQVYSAFNNQRPQPGENMAHPQASLEILPNGVDITTASKRTSTDRTQSAVSGMRVVNVEWQNNIPTHHQGRHYNRFNLFLTNYSLKGGRHRDYVHLGPLGGRLHSSAREAPLTREQQTIPITERHISGAWDWGCDPFTQSHPLLHQCQVHDAGYQRTAAALAVLQQDFRLASVKADADHLYLFSSSRSLVILSF